MVAMSADNAHAYLDPGTGSYVLQILLAALLGVSFTAKVFWKNVKAFFANLMGKGRRGENDDK